MTARPRAREDGAALRLRRLFFRALTGDQAVGDRLARATGGTPGSNDAETPCQASSGDDRAAILCTGIRRWRTMHKDGLPSLSFSRDTIARRLSPHDNLTRQTGLLVDVFGLSLRDAGVALDRSEGEITRLLAESRATLAGADLGRVLIVEDDPVVAGHLASIANGVGTAKVRMASCAEEAFAAAAAAPPHIVLCDYDLGDGPNGADVVSRLSSEYDCVCVFVTAYSDRVLSGEDGEPAFIISKPFGDRTVAAVLAYAATAARPALAVA